MTKNKRAKESCDSLQKMNRIIGILLEKNDVRIEEEENRLLFKEALREIVSKGFIRTHAILSNMLQTFFENGELSPITFHELVDDLPWNWDITRSNFDSLLEEGLVQYSRDSKGQLNCELLVENRFRVRQLDNLQKFYKRENQQPLTTIAELRNSITQYSLRLNEWFKRENQISKLKSEIKQAPSHKLEAFERKLANIIIQSNGEELEATLLTFLKQKPLLQYSLEREK